MVLHNRLFSKYIRPTYSYRALKYVIFNAKLMRCMIYSGSSILFCQAKQKQLLYVILFIGSYITTVIPKAFYLCF